MEGRWRVEELHVRQNCVEGHLGREVFWKLNLNLNNIVGKASPWKHNINFIWKRRQLWHFSLRRGRRTPRRENPRSQLGTEKKSLSLMQGFGPGIEPGFIEVKGRNQNHWANLFAPSPISYECFSRMFFKKLLFPDVYWVG